jgi:hypothetical protein
MQLIFEEAPFLRSRLRVRLRGTDKVMVENSVQETRPMFFFDWILYFWHC